MNLTEYSQKERLVKIKEFNVVTFSSYYKKHIEGKHILYRGGIFTNKNAVKPYLTKCNEGELTIVIINIQHTQFSKKF